MIKKQKALPGKVVRAGEKISKERKADLGSEEARVMKEFFNTKLNPKSSKYDPKYKERYDRAIKLAKKHYEGKSLRELAEKENVNSKSLVKWLNNLGLPTLTRTEAVVRHGANLTKKERKAKSKRHAAWWDSLSEAERAEVGRKGSEVRTKNWENLSPEERAIKVNEARERMVNWWDSLSLEEIEETNQKKSEGHLKRWANMSEEKRKEMANKVSKSHKELWENMSEEEKQRRKTIFSAAQKSFFDSPEGQIRRVQVSEFMKDYWGSMPEKEKKKFIEERLAKRYPKGREESKTISKISNTGKEAFRSLPVELQNEWRGIFKQIFKKQVSSNEASFLMSELWGKIKDLPLDKIPYKDTKRKKRLDELKI